MSDGQLTFAVVRPPVRIPAASLEKPVEILQRCKAAALKADVSLRWWTEFRATSGACLTPDCEPEELALFLEVVKQRFEVTIY